MAKVENTVAYLPVADLGFAREVRPDVDEGRPKEVLLPTEDRGPREVFFSRATCLP